MGYYMFDSICVCVYVKDDPEKIRQEVIDLIPNEVDGSSECKRIVSPLIPSIRSVDNSFFIIAPDGGKEGWGFSEEMDIIYKNITDYLRTKMVKFVHVRFGESPAYIVNSNDD